MGPPDDDLATGFDVGLDAGAGEPVPDDAFLDHRAHAKLGDEPWGQPVQLPPQLLSGLRVVRCGQVEHQVAHP